jgi:8-oxo-dGTP diphosphatase
MLPYLEYLQSLPKKRMAAGCLFLDEDERILLVKPGYIEGWSIPGGVVEQDESPKACCQREIQEEIGVDWSVGELLILDYNHPRGEKSESLVFIFFGGKFT